MILQDMVLQTWNGKDYLLPAFPKNWGVKYKLHSYAGKVVEGEYNWREKCDHHFVDGICTECGIEDPELNWYDVSTPVQLQQISELVNDGNYDIKVRLTADIDLSSIRNFPPIGKLCWPQGPSLHFGGIFDGQGHVIYNLNIDSDDPGAETGLFGRLDGATVKNLGIVNATFKNSFALRAGILAGCCAGQSAVTNCFTAGEINMEGCICRFNATNGDGLCGLINGGGAIYNSYTTYGTIGDDDNGAGIIRNCYWGKEVMECASTGELCYKLNRGQGMTVWFQKLGEDAYPVLNPERGFVILNKDGRYENATGIPHPDIDAPSGSIFNLMGQKIQKALKGICIVDGKKILVK